MKKLILPIIIGGLATVAINATAYQGEIGLGYRQATMDENTEGFGDIDMDGWSIFGQFYFENLDTSRGALAEAPFLNKSSSLHFYRFDSNIEFPNGFDTDATINLLGGRLVTSNNWIFEAQAQDGIYDFRLSLPFETDIWSIGLGGYISSTTELLATYEHFNSGIAYKFDMHSYQALDGGKGFAWDLGLQILNPDSDDDDDADSTQFLSAGVTYYFTPSFGLGGTYHYGTGDDSDYSTFDIGADFFVTSALRISLDYEMFEYKYRYDGFGDSYEDKTEVDKLALNISYLF